MSSSKHTPGPWIAVRISDDSFRITGSPDSVGYSKPVADVAYNSRPEIQRHDACLISAAPEMLSFIQQFADDRYCDADQINEDHSKDCIACTARYLVSKAEGGV